jgi:hypothetical protein
MCWGNSLTRNGAKKNFSPSVGYHEGIEHLEQPLHDPLVENRGHGQYLQAAVHQLNQLIGFEGQVLFFTPVALAREQQSDRPRRITLSRHRHADG